MTGPPTGMAVSVTEAAAPSFAAGCATLDFETAADGVEWPVGTGTETGVRSGWACVVAACRGLSSMGGLFAAAVRGFAKAGV